MNVCHEAPSHLVYLNVKQLMGEVLVEDELVLVIDLLAARRLLQHPRLSAGQRLQSPAQLSVFDRSQSKAFFASVLPLISMMTE